MNLPKQLIARIEKIYNDTATNILDGFWVERIGSLRINTLQFPDLKDHEIPSILAEEFSAKNIVLTPFKDIPHVFTFEKENEYALKGTRAFYDGFIYLQWISSMLPVVYLSPVKNTKILDVCAAPGSKTTQIAAMIQNHGTILALEQNQIRHDKLIHNIQLQGAGCIQVIKTDANKYLSTYSNEFDSILLDAPCSAEGRIHLENEKTFWFWNLKNIQEKSELQKQLLRNAYKQLKKWGILIYSTCTLAPEENEWVITDLLNNNPNATLIAIDPLPSINTSAGVTEFQDKTFHPECTKTLRIHPNKLTEGFFIAKIQKNHS